VTRSPRPDRVLRRDRRTTRDLTFLSTAVEECLSFAPDAEGEGVEPSLATVTGALLAEHRIVRDDLRSAEASVLALLCSAMVVMAGVLAVFAWHGAPSESESWLWLVLPAVPLVLVAQGVRRRGDNALRACYARAVERELHRSLHRLSAPGRTRPEFGGRGREGAAMLPSPCWARIGAELDRPARSGTIRCALSAGAWLAVDALLVATTVMALGRVPDARVAAAAGLLYLAMWAALNVSSYRDVFRAGERWSRLVGELGIADGPLVEELHASRPAPPPAFSWRYVLWPRPDDSLVKFAYMAVGFFVGWLAGYGLGLPWPAFADAVLFFAVFELVVYPARYILNDARDLERDREDPNPRRRGKCPDLRYQRPAMFASFVVRVCLALAYLAWLVAHPDTHDLAWAFGLACAALLGFSWWYEAERDRTTARPPETTLGWLPLWLAVSCGGGLRVLLGAYLGLTATWASVLALAALAGMSMHFCLSTMVWALEAADRNPLKPHLRPLLEIALAKSPTSRSAWRRYAQAWFPALPLAVEEPSWRERLTLGAGAFASRQAGTAVVIGPRPLVTASTHILTLPPWRLAPWDWAMMAALTVSLVLGTVAAVGPHAWSAWTMVWALPLAVTVGWVLARSRPAPGMLAAVCALPLVAALMVLEYHPSRLAQVVVPCLTMLIPMLLYLVFRTTSWADLTRNRYAEIGDTLEGVAVRSVRASYEWFVRPRGGRQRKPPG